MEPGLCLHAHMAGRGATQWTQPGHSCPGGPRSASRASRSDAWAEADGAGFKRRYATRAVGGCRPRRWNAGLLSAVAPRPAPARRAALLPGPAKPFGARTWSDGQRPQSLGDL